MPRTDKPPRTPSIDARLRWLAGGSRRREFALRERVQEMWLRDSIADRLAQAVVGGGHLSI